MQCVEHSQPLASSLTSILRRNAASILGITQAGGRRPSRPPAKSPCVDYDDISNKGGACFGAVIVRMITAQGPGRSRNFPRTPAKLEPRRLGAHDVSVDAVLSSSLGEVREPSPASLCRRRARRHRDS